MINDNSEIILSVRDLRATVGGTEILKGLNLEVRAGEIHAIMGLNGSARAPSRRCWRATPTTR
jgi:Fe-S cluster assembly ATP-binding protein